MTSEVDSGPHNQLAAAMRAADEATFRDFALDQIAVARRSRHDMRDALSAAIGEETLARAKMAEDITQKIDKIDISLHEVGDAVKEMSTIIKGNDYQAGWLHTVKQNTDRIATLEKKQEAHDTAASAIAARENISMARITFLVSVITGIGIVVSWWLAGKGGP